MKQNINIFSDFNTDILYNFLNKKLDKTQFKINKPIFGLFYENLFKFTKDKKKSHLSVVWTKVDRVINSFNKIIEYEKVNFKTILKETDVYINLIKQLSHTSDHVLVFSWTLPQLSKGKFLNDFTNDSGLTKNLNFLNKRVAESLKRYKNISYLNSNYVTDKNDSDFNPKLWFLAKIPFTQKVFDIASEEILKTLKVLKGEFVKLIIVDLAVPNDCDDSIKNLQEVRMITVDELKTIAEENLKARSKEVNACKKIITQQVDAYFQHEKQRKLERAMSEVPERIKVIRKKAYSEVFAKEIDNLDPSARKIVDDLIDYMEKKYISVPMNMAKEILLKESLK